MRRPNARLQQPRPSFFRTILSKTIDPNFSSRWHQYLFQTSLATLFLIVLLVLEDAVLNSAIVVAIASSAFIVFVFPDSVAATPRKVIGGHVLSVIVGSALWLAVVGLGLDVSHVDSRVLRDVAAALSVGISLFIMIATNTEHPPAAGTALGLMIDGATWSSVAFVLISAVILMVVRHTLRSKLHNLL